MEIIEITETPRYRHLIKFKDGTKVWFLRHDQNQVGPGIDPAMSIHDGAEYIRVAFDALKRQPNKSLHLTRG